MIGIGLLIIGQVVWLHWRDQPAYGLPFVIVGCVALWLVRDAKNPVSPEQTGESSENQAAAHLRPLRNGAPFLVAGIGLIIFVGWRGTLQPPGNVWVLLGLWGLGIALVFYGFIPSRAIADWIGRVRHSIRIDRREWLFVVVLFGIALFLRVIWLDSAPPVMTEDEGYFSLQAANIGAVLNWEQNPFTFDSMQQLHPMLFHTLQALSIELFGRTMAAPRLPAALLGALTIPGLYLAARRMFDRRVAVVSAIFLVTFAQHLHWSRLALNNIADTTSVIWLFAFLTTALRTGDPVEYGLAGVVLGLSQYGSSTSRLIPILFVVYVGLFVLTRQLSLAKNWSPLTITVTLAVVIIWPEAYGLASQQTALFPRLEGIATWQIGNSKIVNPITDDYAKTPPLIYWTHQITQSVLGFVQVSDTSVFYGDFDPFLGWVAPIFFLIGLALAIRYRKEPHWSSLIIWWLLTVILGGVLLTDPPQYQRFLIVAPGLAIIVAVGIIHVTDLLAWLSRTLTPEQPVPHRIEYWWIPVGAVLALAGFNAKTYLIDYRLQHGYFRDYHTYVMNQLADTILPSLVGYKIWYFSNYDLNLWSTPILKYKVPGAVGEEYDVPGGFDQLGPAWVPHLENLLRDLNEYPGKEAVVIAAHYPKLADVVQQVTQIPGAIRFKSSDPVLDASVVVYYWGS